VWLWKIFYFYHFKRPPIFRRFSLCPLPRRASITIPTPPIIIRVHSSYFYKIGLQSSDAYSPRNYHITIIWTRVIKVHLVRRIDKSRQTNRRGWWRRRRRRRRRGDKEAVGGGSRRRRRRRRRRPRRRRKIRLRKTGNARKKSPLSRTRAANSRKITFQFLRHKRKQRK